jgi:LPXTG-site transpeptidase (sortase) family protein
MQNLFNRLLSGLGTLLVSAGVAILIYIGVTYAQASPQHARTWSALQQVSGRRLASRLSGHQTVAVPKRLYRRALPAPGEPAVRMVIPKIRVDSPVVQTAPLNGVWNVADWAVGHLTSTPNPAESGNGAYAAHDDIKGELFKRLGELAPGDQVIVYTAHAVNTYVVVGQQAVDPSNTSVLAATKQPTITLITCTPYWVDTQRLIVQAVLKSRAPR